MLLAKDSVEAISDLPILAPDGFQITISPSAEETLDDYYVKFVADEVASFGVGKWEETIAPAIKYTLDPATMPHKLVRESSGDFTFSEAVWGDRTVGDLNTNGDPSFVGNVINDIYFWRGRLGLLADDNFLLSEVSEAFNFFRTTVIQLLDSDPIDVSVGHTKSSILRHAVPYNDQLILFSDQTQFIVSDDGTILTPKTATVTQSTAFESSVTAKPMALGRVVYFAEQLGNYTGIQEYFKTDSAASQFDATSATHHVPKYIQGNPVKIAGSSHEDIVTVLTDENRNLLYVYKFLFNNNAKVQASWSKFDFGADAAVLNMDWIESTLYMVVQREEGLFLEKTTIEAGRADVGLDFVLSVDRRACPTGVYDAPTNLTTFTIPYEVPVADILQVIITADSTANNEFGVSYDVPAGFILDTERVTSTTFTVPNDYSAATTCCGTKYTFSYTFSKPHLRVQKGEGVAVVSAGRYQVLRGTLRYSDSAAFTVNVTPQYRETTVNEFTWNILGQGLVLGEVNTRSGEFRFPILCTNDDLTLEVTNDTPLPSNLVSLEYEVNYTSRASR